MFILKTIQVLLITLLFSGFISISSFINVYAGHDSPSCTVTTPSTELAPGETVTITISWSDNIGHPFTYRTATPDGPNVSQTFFSDVTSPFSFEFTVPDDPTRGRIGDLRFFYPARQPHRDSFSECNLQLNSTLPPLEGTCLFDWEPKEGLRAGDPITITVSDTIPDLSYSARLGSAQSPSVRGSNSNITLTLIPSSGGGQRITVTGIRTTGLHGPDSCIPVDDNLVTLLPIEPEPDPSGFRSGVNPCEGGTCPTALGNIDTTDITKFAGNILTIALGLAGGIALILMVFGAIRILTSSGDQKALAAGRDIIIAALTGLLFLIFSVLILRTLGLVIGITL